jgi:hypothetical protein
MLEGKSICVGDKRRSGGFIDRHKAKTYDSARSTERVGGEVGSELGLDDTRVTVRPRDTSPHDSDLGAVDFSLGLVDVGNSL